MLQVDSRKIKSGDTFLALRGVDLDGHNFINKAIENGATKIICEEGEYDVETVHVSNTRDYLSNYLKEEYKEVLSNIKIIGITGTNGKTTSAYLLHTALNKLGVKTAYIGTIGFYMGEKIKSLNNTTPDLFDLYNLFNEAYLNGAKIVVMEVSSQGICNGRIQGLEFDVGVFTNLTQDHLDYHKTMENYALAKQEMFKSVRNFALINCDDEYSKYYMLDDNKNITYGFSSNNYKLMNYEMSLEGTYFEYKDMGSNVHKISTSLIGKYNIYNLLTTIVILKEYGFKDEDIERVVKDLKTPNGRMNIIDFNSNKIVIDYAHTPDALEKIITTFKEMQHNKIITLFGCTGDRDKLKRPIMLKLASSLSDYVIITSDDLHNETFSEIVDDMLVGNESSNYEIIEDRERAIECGVNKLRQNDILLILGKGHEDVIIINDKRIPLNDKNIVEKIIREKVEIYA